MSSVIKSFVLRQSRTTNAQQRSVDTLLPVYGIPYHQETALDCSAIFGNRNPTIIEIGFGMGDSTFTLALENPQYNYIGIEVHTPGVGTLLNKIHQHSITNLKIMQHDAVEVLKHMISSKSIFGFHIFFPDPWPKKRHNKRRIINQTLISLICSKLISNGYICVATDCEDYAKHISATLSAFANLSVTTQNGALQNLIKRPITKFEQRALDSNATIFNFMVQNNE